MMGCGKTVVSAELARLTGLERVDTDEEIVKKYGRIADIFSKYANNSTTSVVTVLCDQQKPLGKTILCAFGVGLAWGGAALDLTNTYNGGISTYYPPKERVSHQKQIENWIKYFKGEENE